MWLKGTRPSQDEEAGTAMGRAGQARHNEQSSVATRSGSPGSRKRPGLLADTEENADGEDGLQPHGP